MTSVFAVFTPFTGDVWTSGNNDVRRLASPFSKKVAPSAAFEVQHVSFDIEQTLNIGSQSSGAGAGKITFNPLTFTRQIDTYSPTLLTMAAGGTAFEYVDLYEVQVTSKPGAKPITTVPLIARRFGLVAIMTLSWNLAATEKVDGGGSVPTETVTVEFGSISEAVPTSVLSDGSVPSWVQAGWSQVTNQPV